MNLKLFFSVFAAAVFFYSCQEVIDIPLNSSEPALVIEGNVNNGTNEQVVYISQTKPFSASSSFNGVSGAEVSIETGRGRIVPLSEQSKGVYITRSLVGRPGETYKLLVKNKGREYQAVSTMPKPVPFDSLRLTLTTFMDRQSKSIEAAYKDSAGIENYYLFRLIVNNIPSKKIFVFSDEFTDGKIVSQDLYDFDIDLKKEDQVEVWFHGIDKNVYRYWLGMSLNENRGAASTTPANPVSNISGGVLGYFSAQCVQRRSTVIP